MADFSAPPLNRDESERTGLLVVLAAACLFFATLEYLIPKPVPFFRLGLANLPLILALPYFRFRELCLLTLFKVLGQALIGGTLISYVFLFSTAGSFASLLLMYGLWRLVRGRLSWVSLSLAGAMASNVVQMLLSLTFIFGLSAWIFAPVLYLVGAIAGVMVGLAADLFAGSSCWYASLGERLALLGPRPASWLPEAAKARLNFRVPELTKARAWRFRWQLPPRFHVMDKVSSPRLQAILALGVLPAFLLQDDLVLRLGLTLFWLLLCLLAGKRLQPLYFISMALAIVFFNLFNHAGEVLVQLGYWAVTAPALYDGLHKALGILGMVFISLALTRPGLTLPGKSGETMARVLAANRYLMEQRGAMKGRLLMEGIDKVLTEMEVNQENLHKVPPPEAQAEGPAALAFTVILLLVHYTLLFV